jgi:predicted nucleotidyltransferase
MTDFNIEEHLVLKVIAGSRAYGTYNEESDFDMRGVIIPPKEYFFGLGTFEQYSPDPNGPHGDVCYYDIRKFLKLALKGNANILEIFKSPVIKQSIGVTSKLLNLWPHIVSKQIIKPHIGMATNHLKKLKNPNRKCGTKGKAAIEAHGYNTKDAHNVVRVLDQCWEILSTGNLSLPRWNANLLVDIRNGHWSLEEVNEYADFALEAIRKMEDGREECAVPRKPNLKVVEKTLIEIVEEFLS